VPVFNFQKLVRDKIVGFSIDDPHIREVKYRALEEGVEYRAALREKIFEEGQEIPIQDTCDNGVIEEIADLQTVIDTLCKSYGISEEELKLAQRQKIAEKGGFNERHFIEWVDCDEKSQWAGYFQAQPEKYKEITKQDIGSFL
jgi:predicted house-cleaning noncanonical NTP pyrophosphatase (MazG superfamily)